MALDAVAPDARDDRGGRNSEGEPSSPGIAIIGMAGRFPDAKNVAEFWNNLITGKDSVSHFQQAELEASQAAAAQPGYVAARSVLQDVDLFDAEFFGIYPREAELMDPQHRVFLECAWEALESAGHAPAAFPGMIGVFAGCSMNTYFMHNLVRDRAFVAQFAEGYQSAAYTTMLGNDKDFLPTRVSYKMNLRGPSLAIQTACSTSLVAIAQACQSLLMYGCDMALAGAVSITFPQKRGYVPEEGGILSTDGSIRPFDRDARGTVFGHGAGVVVLKRLEDAEADGDSVLAVIRGFAVNNDGSTKAGYTAPSVNGQADVIASAQAMAGFAPETITYLEAHGTGTPLGDPAEVSGLKRAFGAATRRKQFCVLGTAKGHVGHLDVASGVTGLIKTVLQMQHREIPKLLNFKTVNRQINLAETPFYIPDRNVPWKAGGLLRAGVSAFGVGGTNAHVVVEEYVPPGTLKSENSAYPEADRNEILVLSAKTPQALDEMKANLAGYLEREPSCSLKDVAHTLQHGRARFDCRQAFTATTKEDAAAKLRAGQTEAAVVLSKPASARKVVFLFPGQGAQAVGMGRLLFEQQPVFRETLEEADALVRPFLPNGLIAAIYPPVGEASGAEQAAYLNRTEIAQPAIFAVSCALTRLWKSLGIEPALLVGHSIGEFVAATVAGLLSFEEALRLVAARGSLMQQLPGGAMLAVRSPFDRIAPYLALDDQAVGFRKAGEDPGDENRALAVDVASLNGPKAIVLSGSFADIELLAARLSRAGIASRKVATSHAFHSRMMDPVMDPFRKVLESVSFKVPEIPWISTLTGDWIKPEAVMQPEYWLSQLRSPVLFAAAMDRVLQDQQEPGRLMLEVGPGRVLTNLVRQLPAGLSATPIASLPDAQLDASPFEQAVAQLWEHGQEIVWKELQPVAGRRRIALPTYPFQRKRFWISPPEETELAVLPAGGAKAAFIRGPGISTLQQEQGEVPGQNCSPLSEAIPMPELSSKTVLLDALKSMVAELSDLDLSRTSPETSFLELGLDSLFLTQLTQSIRARFGVKLTFRQIMGDYSTFDTLAAHLANVVPSEKLPAAPAAPSAVLTQSGQTGYTQPAFSSPASSTSPSPGIQANLNVGAPALLPIGTTGADAYTALFAQQMSAMSALLQQQLAVLQGANTYPAANSVTSAPKQVPPTLLPARPAAAPQPALEKELGTLMPLKPLDLHNGEALSQKQQQYFDSLMERYGRRTAKSKAAAQRYRGVLADPRVASGFNPQFKEMVYPLTVERSSGAYLWDLDGNRYIDILNGYGSILFGHSPHFVTEAVRQQLDLGFPIGPQTELAGECAELLTSLVGMERATFCNTGSEAVMAAMRLARTVTGRSLIVLFAGAYHGQIDEVLVKSNRSEKSIPTAPGIPDASVANMLVLEYGSQHALDVIRRRADDIAAVLVEPIQSRHPELRPKEFLQQLRTITEDAGAALIFDEVVTGFRAHLGGAQALYGIRADMATYGKVVAGGMPVGVVAGSRTYMDALDGGTWQFGDSSIPQVGVTFFAGTFVRHPLTMAAVRATLRHLRDAGTELQEGLAARNTALVDDLNSMFKEYGFPSHIEHFASWFYFSVPPEFRLAKLLFYHLRELGLHLQEGFPCFLTTAHTDQDLVMVRDAFRQVLREMHGHDIIRSSEDSKTPAAQLTSVMAGAEPSSGHEAESCPLEAHITEAQREILLASQLGGDASCAFNESVTLRLQGILDVALLEQALREVIERHEALRLSVSESGDQIRVQRRLEFTLQQQDWLQADEAEQDRRLALLLHQEASTPFNLREAPLFRAVLVRQSDERAMLIFTGHHIVVDGWSINVLFEEAGQLYSAARTKKRATLLPVHSFLEQARTEDAEPSVETERYWLDQFRTLPPPMELPLDRPRTALRNHRGATLRRTLPRALFNKLKAGSARNGNTLFTTLLSGYFLLLSRLTHQSDLVVGIPLAGQRNFAGKSFIGHAVNFLPIRAQVDATAGFSSLCRQVRDGVYEALDHQEYTLGTLVRKLRIPGNAGRLALVEAQFNLEQVGKGVSFEGLSTRIEANAKTAVNADIFFNFVDRGDDLVAEVDYNTGLLEESTIERWIDCLSTLLDSAADREQTPAGRLEWLTPAAAKQVLVDWNKTDSSYPAETPVHRLFEQQAESTPDKVALLQDQQKISYAELNALANQFARWLEREHSGGKIRLALSLDRSPSMFAAILGVLKAGGLYIPIDPGYPPARLALLVEDSQPTLLLTQESMLGNFKDTGIRAVTIESLTRAGALSGYSPDTTAGAGGAEDPAYIIYTSGSTGRPKGVVVPHRAIVRLVKGSDFIHFGADEIFLQLAPISFDASTLEIWGALLHGSTLVMMNSAKPSPEEIGKAIAENGITTLWLTAALFHLMVMDHLPLLQPLRQLLAGGDVLSVSHVQKVLESIPTLRLVNGYGPTENTTFTCCHTITLESLGGSSVPIGRPISNTRVYVLDAELAPVPVGVPGQLYAAGDGLALGYWHAPELTAARFLDWTVPTVAGVEHRAERLYATGDTVRYREDGTLLFLGRHDNQVKIRGFRVELGEIEAAAERVPGVRAAIVAARPDWNGPEDIPGDKRLALYFLPTDQTDVSVVKQRLREYLGSQLPDHMQPAAILPLESFPRTANGKVDYRALPAPEAERRLHTKPVAGPRNDVEAKLAAIWCKVLQLDSVSIHDSIFELGGDSLSIFRITTQANQAGIRMTAKHLFQYKTIAAVAPQLEGDGSAPVEQAATRSTIRPVSREGFRRTQSLTDAI